MSKSSSSACATACGHSFALPPPRIVDELCRGAGAVGEDVARGEDAVLREQHDDVAVGMRLADLVNLDGLAADVDRRVLADRDVRLARLIRRDHARTRFDRSDGERAHRLQLRVAAAVIAMVVRVDDVLDRLVRHGLQHRDDVVVVDLELVVDEQHALVGDQRRHEPRHCDVADDVDVVANLDELQLRRLAAELRLRVRREQGEGGTAQAQDDSVLHDVVVSPGVGAGSAAILVEVQASRPVRRRGALPFAVARATMGLVSLRQMSSR